MSVEIPVTVDNDKETRTQRLVHRLSRGAVMKVVVERVTWFTKEGEVRTTDTRFTVDFDRLTDSGNVASIGKGGITRDELLTAAASLAHIAETALVEDAVP